MNQTTLSPPQIETLADLLERLGSIPLERIRFRPAPGTATEDDVVSAAAGPVKHLCELVDGVLVEKAMGFYEARLAFVLGHILEGFAQQHDLGIVVVADGLLRLAEGLVRIPDVSFLSWEKFPDRRLPSEPIPNLAPELAVEVLSKSNTRAEMNRKLRDYFEAGTKLVWYLDPETRTARVYNALDECTVVTEDGVLDGGSILPGFRLPLREWFTRAGAQTDNRSE